MKGRVFECLICKIETNGYNSGSVASKLSGFDFCSAQCGKFSAYIVSTPDGWEFSKKGREMFGLM